MFDDGETAVEALGGLESRGDDPVLALVLVTEEFRIAVPDRLEVLGRCRGTKTERHESCE